MLRLGNMNKYNYIFHIYLKANIRTSRPVSRLHLTVMQHTYTIKPFQLPCVWIVLYKQTCLATPRYNDTQNLRQFTVSFHDNNVEQYTARLYFLPLIRADVSSSTVGTN